jgi:putative ABC transport system substrate-binding protein
LVKHNVDVIVALSDGCPSCQTSNQCHSHVAIGMTNPVDDELVASLARPGGNVTGTSFVRPQLVTKRLQLLTEVVPQHTRATSGIRVRTMTGR